jgi:hypothetical protein
VYYYNFFNVLTRQYPNLPATPWNFTGDARSLSANSLLVHTYNAIGTADAVGADIDVEYKPAAGTNDPTANIHWVQVVSTNNKITYGPAPDFEPQSNPGTLDNKVDVRRTNTTNPYYDNGFAANSRNFIDTPRRPDVEFDNTWTAALFLVSGPNTAGNVTIYNDSGILWGWQNIFVPDFNLVAFKDEVENELKRDYPNNYVNYINEFEAELAAVPEPPTLISVVVAGVCGVTCSWRRYRRQIPAAA